MIKLLSVPTFFFREISTIVLTIVALYSANILADEWDWQPRELLTPSQLANLKKYCHGSYIDQWHIPETKAVTLFADHVIQNSDGELYLTGNAELLQESLSLQADSIISKEKQNYSANGSVILRQKGQLITSDQISLSSVESLDATLNNATFLFHQAGIRGAAKEISHTEQGIIFIEEGFYTSCEPDSNSWRLYGSSIKLDSNTGFGTAKHVRIHIAGIPVFYFPWLRFPIDNARHSGFLFPSIGYSSSDGIELSTPYYLNLAPNYDATITPNLVQHQGAGVDIEIRHLSPYGNTAFEQSSFQSNDEGLQITRKLSSKQQFSNTLSAGLLAEDNLTEGLYPESNTTSLGEQDNYERSIYLDYTQGSFNTRITNKRYQTPDASDDAPLEWLPRISSSFEYNSNTISYQPSWQYTDFFDPDGETTDGARQVINQTLEFPLGSSWGYFTPGLLSQYRHYDFNDGTTAELNSLSYYIDSGLIFEKQISTENGSWRQTLEPKVSYLYVPYTSQNDIPDFDTSELNITYSQAFSHTRFTGNDRVGDTNQFAFGLESRFFDSNNNERWSLRLGQILYLEDRRISVEEDDDSDIDTTEESALFTSISYQETELLSLSLDLNYSTEQETLELGLFAAEFAFNNGIRFNSHYLYTIDEDDSDDNIKQSQVSAILPITDHWHSFYQHTYDWIEDETNKNIVGFGFENCCVKASMSYQHWHDDDDEVQNGFYLQFILRNLGGAGNSSSIESIENDYWNEGNIGYE